MNSIAISSIVFACVLGGAVFGMWVRTALPQHHLGAETKDAVKLGMGLVATMSALVLGLLVSSAKSSYDAQTTEVTEMSAKIVLLDRVLARYGPDAEDARGLLRAAVARLVDQIWSNDLNSLSQVERFTEANALFDRVLGFSPKDDKQRSLQAEVLSLTMSLGQTRWLMYEQRLSSVSIPLLIVLSFWLSIIFISFGLFAPSNMTVVATLFVSALSVSSAIFLILEMYTPYAGLIQISSAPMRAALAHLGQ
jgi:hypothetical protein